METIRKSPGVGRSASIALGLTYILVGVGFWLQPAAQRKGTADESLASVATDALGFSIVNWSLAVGGLLALAAVPWICTQLAGRDLGWIAWARNLGLVGFGVAAVNGFRTLALVPDQAENFVHERCDEFCRLAVRGDFVNLSLDPDGWITFGAVGLFVLIVAVVAVRQGAMSLPLAAVGISAGAAYLLVVAGSVMGSDWLIGVAAAVGGVILAPVFYIWIGLSLDGAEAPLEVAVA